MVPSSGKLPGGQGAPTNTRSDLSPPAPGPLGASPPPSTGPGPNTSPGCICAAAVGGRGSEAATTADKGKSARRENSNFVVIRPASEHGPVDLEKATIMQKVRKVLDLVVVEGESEGRDLVINCLSKPWRMT